MILVAILAFNAAVFGSAIRAGMVEARWYSYLIVAFGWLVGVQILGPIAVASLIEARRARTADAYAGAAFLWILFLPCAAAVIQVLIYGR